MTAFGLTLAAGGGRAATIDLFAGPVLWSEGGRVSVFDSNRAVHTRLSDRNDLCVGIRFGFPLSGRVALELSLRGFTSNYDIALYDRRYDAAPDFELLGGVAAGELPQVMLDLRCRLLPVRLSPYAALGVGYLGVDPELNSSSPAFNVAAGWIGLATRSIGLRVDVRYTYSRVNGLAAQDRPPRMIPYTDDLSFAELTAGIILNLERRSR